MKLLVIGCGQCGGRIADEFARLNTRAHVQRGLEIITDCFAVNTDMADLSGLYRVRRDYQHRIIIGQQRTGGHGVGKINELGAEIAREDSDNVIEAVLRAQKLSEADAFLVAASAAGGTGSGTIPVLTQRLKEYYPQKPVYNLIVLPFKYEEMTEERIIYNTATCLKSAFLVADAIFLVDNQRFVRRGLSFRNNLSEINSLVVRPFYNLLCAGEETHPEYVGSRVVDAGDIIQTLAGWTAIGYGRAPKSIFGFFKPDTSDFRKKATGAQKELLAMQVALDDLSLKCRPTDARRALYLLCAPPERMSMDLVGDLSDALRNIAREAVIRSGDYPRTKHSLDITIILSELSNLGKVTDYFTKVILYIAAKKKQKGVESEYRRLEDAFKDIPSLL